MDSASNAVTMSSAGFELERTIVAHLVS